MSGPRCETGLPHLAPAAPDAVRLPWEPYDARPYITRVRACTTCRPGETFGWGLSEGRVLLRRIEWRRGTSQIVVASTRTQALIWWADLLAGRAV